MSDDDFVQLACRMLVKSVMIDSLN